MHRRCARLDEPAEGAAAGEFAEFVQALRAEAAYVNVHSAAFGSGEIRGQVTLQPFGFRERADPQVISRTDLWLYDFTRNTVTRFLPAGEDPVWSPDGREVIFDTDVGMYKHAVDGVQPQTLMATSIVGRRAPTSWSPDGRTLNNLKTSSDIWVMILSATPTVEPFLQTSANESRGQFSPAAKLPLVVAYTSNETRRDEVFVRTFPGGGNRQMVSSSGGHSPRWRGDGRELFYVAPDGMVMSVTITDVGPGTRRRSSLCQPVLRREMPHLLGRLPP